MRTLSIGFRTVAIAALSLSTSAFAAQSQSGSMLQPGGPGYNRDACGGAASMVPGAAFNNGTSRGAFKFQSNCHGIIKLSNLFPAPLSDGIPATGDEAICLINFQSNAPALSCGTFMLRGEIAGTPAAQKVKIKLNGPAQLPAGLCPLAAGSDARVTSVECFLPDPAYGGGSCAGTFTGFITDPSQGLCFPAPSYMPNPPGIPVIAVQGVLF
jgi:hypothetical protein